MDVEKEKASQSHENKNGKDASPEKLENEPKPAAGNKKIDVLLRATGDAPIMKKKKWAVEGEKPVGWVIEFIRKYLKLDANDSLFLYVNQSFAPAPDQIVRNLYDCFGSDGKLVLHYCKTQAWG
ncbi:autophagy-related 12 [Oratosquilla oratoria]|uniref:autophagy-related 12 n=1 Tax=Oratosquilla oratoria TaxID=337810 RepID=UPI003F764CB2